MRNFMLSTALAMLVVAGCASSEWNWTDPGVHVVAGAWLLDEVSCEMDAPDMCGVAIRAARDWVEADDRSVVTSGRWAQIPREWADSTGRKRHMVFAGLLGPSVAIVLLESGEVRSVALMCGREVRSSAGDVVQAAVCSPQGAIWTQYLVGATRPADNGF